MNVLQVTEPKRTKYGRVHGKFQCKDCGHYWIEKRRDIEQLFEPLIGLFQTSRVLSYLLISRRPQTLVENEIELSNKVIMALLHSIIQRSVVALNIPESPNGIHEHHPLVYHLEEELARMFALAGGVRCSELEKRLSRLLRENPRKVEEIVRELVAKYYREKILKGPPDRFREARVKAEQIWATA